MNIKTKIQLGLIFVLVILVLSLILSRKASPDFSPLWALKRIQEKAFLSFQSNPKDKIEYMRALLSIRLRELQDVFNHKNYNYILPASLRYSTTAGQITDLIIANNLTGQVDEVKKQFLSHEKILHDLYVAYPKNFDDEEYKYIEDDINYLNLYLDKLTTLIKYNN